MKLTKRILALVLALVMVIGLLPMSTLAATTTSDAFKLVTDVADLAAGDQVVIACPSKNVVMGALSTTSTQYGTSVDATIANDILQSTGAIEVLSVVEGETEGQYAFQYSDGKYVAWNSGNSLAANDAAYYWTVAIKDEGTTITSVNTTGRKLQYNAGSPRFACYTSSQTAVALYKLDSGAAACEHTNVVAIGAAKDANCTEDGITAGEKCADCGIMLAAQQTIPATGHTYVEGTCSVCGVAEPEGYVLTNVTDIKANDKVIITITNKDGDTYALTNDKGTSDAPTAVKVKVVEDTVTPEDTNILWNIAYDNGNLTIYPNGKTDSWLYCTNTNNGVRVGTNTNKVFTVDADTGYLKHTATSRYIGVFNNADWRCYANTTYTCSKCGESYTGNEVEAAHIYGDGIQCTVEGCGYYKPDSALTIAQALELADKQTDKTFTADKYYLTGTITEVKDTTYGNSIIADAEGTSILIYGLYSADGTVRYDALERKPVVGDTITVYGALGKYGTTLEMQSGWIQEHTVHECKWIDGDIIQGATCTEKGSKNQNCEICGETKTAEIPSTGHDYESVHTDGTFEANGYTTYTCKNDSTHTYVVQDDPSTQKTAVAQIGETKYGSLAEAFTAVSNGDTLKLLTNAKLNTYYNIPADKGAFTLDLNSQTLDVGAYWFAIANDLTVTGSGRVTGTANCIFSVAKGAKLTIEGDAQFSSTSGVILPADGAAVVLNGGIYPNAGIVTATGFGAASITKAESVVIEVPDGYHWVGNKLEMINYVAQVSDKKYETLEAAIADAGDGDTVTLLTDATLNQAIEITNGAITLALGNFDLTMTGPAAFRVKGEAKLTVTGSGDIKQDNGSTIGVMFISSGNSELNLNTTGVLDAGLTVAQAGDSAVVNINNGTLSAWSNYQGKSFVLNYVDSAISTAKINLALGVKFVGFDPAKAQTEPTADFSFCAEGYTSEYDAETNTYTVVEKTALVEFAGTTLDVGNSLDINFYIKKETVNEALRTENGYYVQITRSYADGRANDIVKIPSSEWENHNYGWGVTYNKVAGAHMCDTMKVQVFYADGTPASEEKIDGVRLYVMRNFDESEEKLKALLADMLNYGAAAQKFFGYNVNDLANSQLSDAQKACATQSVTMTDNRISHELYAGSTLNLESRIEMAVYFKGITAEKAATMYAKYSFTDIFGKKIEVDVTADELKHYSGNIWGVVLDKLTTPNAGQLVEVTLYNADGSVYGTVTDSAESYIARMSNSDPMYQEIMKFATSAKAYFGK